VDPQSGSLIDDDNRELDAVSGPLKSTKMMRKEHISSQESSSRSYSDLDVGGDSDHGSDIPYKMEFVGKEIGVSVEREGMSEKNDMIGDHRCSTNTYGSNTEILEEDSIINSDENSNAPGAECRVEDENGGRRGDERQLNMVLNECHRSSESTGKGEFSYGQDRENINTGVRNEEMKNKQDKVEEEDEEEEEDDTGGRERVVRCSDEEVEVEVEVDDAHRIPKQTTRKIPLPVDVVSGIIR
jgi:hypothetical protein